MTPARIGATISGTIALLLILVTTRFPWFDAVAWFLALLASGLAAVYGAAVVRTIQQIRRQPRSLFVPVLILIGLSGFPLYSHYRQAREARQFLATADSARGVVTRTIVRGGIHLVAQFKAGTRLVQVWSPGGVDSLTKFVVGDSIWLYFPPAMPDSAHFGHPSADSAGTRNRLLLLWLGGGPLLCGYGGSIVYFARPSTYSVPRGTA